SRPAARMREMVLATREIWRAWAEGGRIDFRGEFYQHTLITPMFSPGANPYGNPPIFLAGVGPRMTAVAGEVADGFFVHPFHTAKSIAVVTLPAIERGIAMAGRARKDVKLSFQIMVASGSNDEEIERTRTLTKGQIAFYGSTPAYRVVLDAHGWGDLQPELNALSKRGQWNEMTGLISDEILETVAGGGPVGPRPARGAGGAGWGAGGGPGRLGRGRRGGCRVRGGGAPIGNRRGGARRARSGRGARIRPPRRRSCPEARRRARRSPRAAGSARSRPARC